MYVINYSILNIDYFFIILLNNNKNTVRYELLFVSFQQLKYTVQT